MKCPVCKKAIFSHETICQHCGFTYLHREFINRQDAQDWELCVLVPYREKWKKGILNADSWLNRIYECSVFHAEIEKEKATKLRLDSNANLNVNNPETFRSLYVGEYNGDIDETFAHQLSMFCNIEEIFISFRYNGQINSNSINQIIHACPKLKKIDFNGAVDCDLLTHIDLSKIEELHVSLRNSFSPTTLYAPVLKSLQITGCMMGIKKKEAKKIKRTLYNLSGMPMLENLSIKYCSDFDYRSLASLKRLKVLRIYDECPIDLFWLSDEYALDYLSVYGLVHSLDGIECQTTLQKLDLRHNNITDISKLGYLPILKHLDLGFNQVANIAILGQLHHLEFIDLTNNPLIDESYLRSLKIPSTIFTKLDKELHSIEEMFTGKVLGTFMGDVYYWMKSWETKDLKTESPYMQNRILKWREKDYQEKTKEIVQMIFQRKYYELCKGYPHASVKKVEKQHKEVYINTALQHYPFLQLTSDMQSDLRNS